MSQVVKPENWQSSKFSHSDSYGEQTGRLSEWNGPGGARGEMEQDGDCPN